MRLSILLALTTIGLTATAAPQANHPSTKAPVTITRQSVADELLRSLDQDNHNNDNDNDNKTPAERRSIPDDEKIGYLVFSHGCVGWSCTDMRTLHWGKEGDYGGCNDAASVFEDACDTQDRRVPTPLGDADWNPADTCDDENGNGGFKGLLIDVNKTDFGYWLAFKTASVRRCWFQFQRDLRR
ncbi:hypothetical protein FE257_012682 [Aspergillus nanangensis]|uniref:Uncharacterized protein n=1 Tax=Aspergillus nanangensis TaxID=2582783 RepID=A0AAD4GQP2_ASPNN|nr:hypothetical protein FE257_012682 [Aspergillus nanangensis]